MISIVTVACSPEDAGDTAPDTGRTTTSSSDSRTDAAYDTGFGYYYWEAGINAPGGVFSDGYYGQGFYGARDAAWACHAVGELLVTGTPHEGCPDCTFVYAVTVGNTTSEGDFCNGTGLASAVDDYDGLVLEIGWGAESYVGAGGTYANPVFRYLSGYDWELFGFLDEAYGFTTAFTPDGMTLLSPLLEGSGADSYWRYGYYYRY